MSAKNKTLSVAKVIAYVFLLLAIVAVIGFFALFTNGFTSDFRGFYVQIGEQRITTTENKLTLPHGFEFRFDCKYTFNIFRGNSNKVKGYTVKVVPNISDKTLFDFTVDGQQYSYAGETDLTAAFDIQKYDDYFTVNIPANMDIQQILKTVYNGKTVIVPELRKDGYYYKLLISSYDEKITYSIIFNLCISVTGIEIDKGVIVL